jgi:hypothetical protein
MRFYLIKNSIFLWNHTMYFNSLSVPLKIAPHATLGTRAVACRRLPHSKNLTIPKTLNCYLFTHLKMPHQQHNLYSAEWQGGYEWIFWGEFRSYCRYSDWRPAGRSRDRSSSPSRGKIFLFSTSSRPIPGPRTPSYPKGNGGSFPGVKWPGREADHSPPTNAAVKNTWIHTSTPPYVFMAHCLIS